METESGHRALSRRREGAKGSRERRLSAEARIRLQLCRDAVRIALHRGGDGFRAREEVEYNVNVGLREQKPPGVLKEPGGQGVATSTRHVAAEAPLVGTPRLQSNDALDQPTVHYLLRMVLLERAFWEDVERQRVLTNEEVDREEAEEAR